MFPAFTDTLHADPLDGLTRAELTERVECVRELKAGLAAYEARLAVAIDALDDSGLDSRGVLRSNGRVSGRTAARVSATAHALEDMPKTRAALQAGRITIEHAHALSKAGADVDSADSEIVDIAESGPADIFAKRATEWVTARKKDDPKPEHDEQRILRSLKRWDDKATGMGMYLLALDCITRQELDSALDRRERQLWEADGDAPPHPKHNVTATLDIAGMTTNDGTPLASLVQDGKPLP